MSPADIEDIHPVSVDDLITLPVDNDGLVPIIVFDTVGSDVPDVIHISIVQVGEVPIAKILHPVIVPLSGITKYLVLKYIK